MTVPVTLLAAKNDIGQDIYPADKMHKFCASVTSYPDTLFYPINSYSYNEVAIFEADIKRVAGQPQLVSTTTPTFKKVRVMTLSEILRVTCCLEGLPAHLVQLLGGEQPRARQLRLGPSLAAGGLQPETLLCGPYHCRAHLVFRRRGEMHRGGSWTLCASLDCHGVRRRRRGTKLRRGDQWWDRGRLRGGVQWGPGGRGRQHHLHSQDWPGRAILQRQLSASSRHGRI